MKHSETLILRPKLQYILLTIIVLLGLILRFYKLGAIPVGFHRDEAYLGYNAYAILKTGRDISDAFLPIHLKSFLYSPAGYSYFSIPFLAIFGLNAFSVRFASALFGTATLIPCFFLVDKLFQKFRYRKELALLTTCLLAITPWHINLSRVATENVIVVFFLTLGTMLYLYWVDNKKYSLLLAAFLCFAATMGIYQAPRAFLPFFIPLLVITSFKKANLKSLVSIVVLFLVFIIIPLFAILHSANLSQRIHMLSIFQNPKTQLILDEQIREEGPNNALVARLFHNKGINYTETFLQNYFEHFSYEFLFTDAGLPDRYRIPQMGLLYLFELPLLLLGAWKLLSGDRKTALFVTGWIILAPIGSALTFDDIPNLQRTLLIFPAFAIIPALGLLELWQLIDKKKFTYLFQAGIILCMGFGVSYYLHQYYVHGVVHRPWYRQEGAQQMVTSVNQLLPKYQKVVITTEETAPEIFVLFYSKYNPATFQQETKNKPWTTSSQLAFNKYTFSDIVCPLHDKREKDPVTGEEKITVVGQKNVLYVNPGTCDDAVGIATLAQIRRPDNTVAYKIQIMK